jgi:hypothetical protein
MEVGAGRPIEAMTHGDHPASGIGDVTDQMVGLALPGPKMAKAARAAEYSKIAIPVAEDLFPATQAALKRAKPLPKAEDLLPEQPTLAAKVEDPFDDILTAPPRARKSGTLSLPETPGAARGVIPQAKEAAGAGTAHPRPGHGREGRRRGRHDPARLGGRRPGERAGGEALVASAGGCRS